MVAKSHDAKAEKHLKNASKGVNEIHFCCYDQPTLRALHCAQLCKRQVKKLHIWDAIGARCDWFRPGWGWDRVDTRIWFAY